MFGPWRDHVGVDREEVVAFLQKQDVRAKVARLFSHISEFAERVMAKVGQRQHGHMESPTELKACAECNEWQKRYGAAFEEELLHDPIMRVLQRRKPPQAPE
jgi:hypothetical protein